MYVRRLQASYVGLATESCRKRKMRSTINLPNGRCGTSTYHRLRVYPEFAVLLQHTGNRRQWSVSTSTKAGKLFVRSLGGRLPQVSSTYRNVRSVRVAAVEFVLGRHQLHDTKQNELRRMARSLVRTRKRICTCSVCDRTG